MTSFPSKERLLSFEILSQALKGKKLDRVFNEVVSGAADSGSRIPQIYNLVYGIARRYKPLSDYIASKVKKAPDEAIKIIMMMAIYELAYNESSKPYAVVDQSLKLCEFLKYPNYKPLVNAVLRGFLRDIDNAKKTIEDTAVLPADIMRELKKTFPIFHKSSEKKIMTYFVKSAPIFLNVNTLFISRDELYERLSLQGIKLEKLDYNISSCLTKFIENSPLVETCLDNDLNIIKTLKTYDPKVFKTQEFNEGLFFVQDLSSQIAVRLLSPKKAEKILDICSAPGGKAMSLAVLSKDEAEILAMDVSSSRLIKLYENIRRLKLKSIKVFNQDILSLTKPIKTQTFEDKDPSQSEEIFKTKTYDRIFLDPPCTALGVIRRNPDLIWSKKTSLIAELSSLQLKMLVKAMELLKPGGRLVYSVCTFTQSETTAVITKALELNKKFILVGKPFYTLVNQEEMDGLFVAVMEKKNA
jgi:16S rRNA (cytosine967-C5)-methyltransferase